MTISGVIANSIMALVVGSIFYNMSDTTKDFYSRSALLFYAILLNAFASALEVIAPKSPATSVAKVSDYHSLRSTSYC